MPTEGLLAGLGLVSVPVTLMPQLSGGFDGTPTGSPAEVVDGTAAMDVTVSYGGHATGGGRAAAPGGGRGTARRKCRVRRRATVAAVVAACLAGGGAWYFSPELDGSPDGSDTLAEAPITSVTDLAAPAGSPSDSPSASASPSKSPSASPGGRSPGRPEPQPVPRPRGPSRPGPLRRWSHWSTRNARRQAVARSPRTPS